VRGEEYGEMRFILRKIVRLWVDLHFVTPKRRGWEGIAAGYEVD
jgi:hypothetical protein